MAEKPRSVTELTLKQLTDFVRARELPAYRARQVWKWVWGKGAVDYAAMTDLGKELRERLAKELPVTALSVGTVRRSQQDGTTKALLASPAGKHVEAVAMPNEDEMQDDGRSKPTRNREPGTPCSAKPGFATQGGAERNPEPGRSKLSVCVSTQAGCAMGCAFCASSVGKFGGNLTYGEILDELLMMSKLAGRRATSVVLMGMGEPLANYDNSLEAVRRITSPDFLGLGARHVTVSTVGLVPQMHRMVEEWPQIGLAVSLHAPNDGLRRKLVPAAAKWSIAEVLEAAGAWSGRTGRRYTVEYVLIEGQNAGRGEAEELAALLRRRPVKVNLIALNTGGRGNFDPPVEGKVKSFRDVLEGRGIEAVIRKRRGRDIEAACGQLRLREGTA
jgi:23S rRNA (adenine2503-C2)-methyltransferase